MCPKCDSGNTFNWKIVRDKDAITYYWRCNDCHHKWKN